MRRKFNFILVGTYLHDCLRMLLGLVELRSTCKKFRSSPEKYGLTMSEAAFDRVAHTVGAKMNLVKFSECRGPWQTWCKSSKTDITCWPMSMAWLFPSDHVLVISVGTCMVQVHHLNAWAKFEFTPDENDMNDIFQFW